jgi:hypothetical protein
MAVTVEKSTQIILATSVIFTETTQRKQSPNMRKFAQSGHPAKMLKFPKPKTTVM